MIQSSDPRGADRERLLLRCYMTIDALEQSEASPLWAEMRATVAAHATRLTDLRRLVAELQPMAALLPRNTRRSLLRALKSQGIDIASERRSHVDAVAAVQTRGRIRSEAEFRRVQAYADTLVDPGDEREYQQLGELLDEFMSRGAQGSRA